MTRRQTVLLVSDDPDLRAALRDGLAAEGWDVAEADGERAATALPDAAPRVVVFDFGPGRARTFAAVQSAAVTYSVPVVALTTARQRGSALALGAEAVASAEELVAILDEVSADAGAPTRPSGSRASTSAAGEAPPADPPEPDATDRAGAEALWARVGAYLRTQLPPDVWERWFAGLRATSLGRDALTLTAPDAAHRDFVAEEYGAWLDELVSNATKGSVPAVVVAS